MLAAFVHYTSKEWNALVKELQTFAETLGLQFTQAHETSGIIEGTYLGFPVVVEFYARTRIITSFNKRMPAGLKIYQEAAIISDIGKCLGGQDIQVQDPQFDKTFIIKGESEDAVRRLLTPPVRDVLMDYNQVAALYLDETAVSHIEPGFVRDTSRIRHILDAQHEVAEALCGAV